MSRCIGRPLWVFLPCLEASSAIHELKTFRIKSLLHPAKKFKVEMNAKQLQMTGVILLHKNINLVVVEGGEAFVSIRIFYRKAVCIVSSLF